MLPCKTGDGVVVGGVTIRFPKVRGSGLLCEMRHSLTQSPRRFCSGEPLRTLSVLSKKDKQGIISFTPSWFLACEMRGMAAPDPFCHELTYPTQRTAETRLCISHSHAAATIDLHAKIIFPKRENK